MDVKNTVIESSNNHIDADDLFHGLSEAWRTKITNSQTDGTNESSDIDDLPQLPDHFYADFSASHYGLEENINLNNNASVVEHLVSEVKHSTENSNKEQVLSLANQDHWTRLKSILGNMRGILEREFTVGNDDNKLTFGIIDRIIAFGDKMDILKRLNKTFNNGLLKYLTHKWMDISENIVNSSPVLKTILSSTSENLSNNLFLPLLGGVGHFFQSSALKHLEDLNFVTELMRSSGFQDIEISEVFKLLDLNGTSLVDEDDLLVEGRHYSKGFMEKSGGYGHSDGGYGHGGGGYMSHGGGGYMMQTIDPFVLLAGLAFATFLAFLLFRLLSQTTGKRRSVPDMSLNLDLSDMPEVMTNLYNFLDTADKKFGNHGEVKNNFSTVFVYTTHLLPRIKQE